MSLKTRKQMRGNRGITLIALVITIIVLLILAGITIASLTGDNGILNKAAEAKIQTGIGEEKEQIALAYHAAMIETNGEQITAQGLQNQINLNGVTATVEEADGSIKVTFATTGNIYSLDSKGNITEYQEPITVEKAKTEGTVFADNTTIKDGYGNEVKIPAGFKIASDSADDVTGGIVVEDATYEGTMGSQFVWIPVGTVYTNKEQTESKTINLDRYTFASDGTPAAQGTATIDSYYQELSTSDYGNATAKDLNAFLDNTRTNGGYYFGRYEAGVQNGTLDTSDYENNGYKAPNTNWTGYTGDNIQLVCKAGEQAWNWITQNKASELSRNMYSSNKFESDLVNSYAWDTAIVYIQTFSGTNNYSVLNNSYTSDATDPKKTGAYADEKCKINDMSGNTREYTTETASNDSLPCVPRGGNYRNGDNYTRQRVGNSTSNSSGGISFRPLLYW